ncbi:2-keto-4-pentenoate hydratase/2-oxohepta-3-ene-1,7-dioic acid hydratase in catechol pathway [Bradyrhizobium sp. GM6.1]
MAGEIKQWLRFRNSGATGFGTLTSSGISVHEGEMFGRHAATGKTLALSEVELLAPCVPSKIVALWNNFHALAAKLNQPEPPEPLYLLKATTSITTPGAVIRRPSYYDGKTTYEGELGIVIGKTCARVSPAEADSFIFGYTCVNDITANDILTSDPTFPQWARAKGIDDYGPFGPVIATGLDPVRLVVRTILNGAERQNYPISDMIFTAQELVSRISHDMTLLPGDLIAVGTSVGVGVMKEPVEHCDRRDRRHRRADQRVSAVASLSVMAGLVPAIHVLLARRRVDAWDKPGHDQRAERLPPTRETPLSPSTDRLTHSAVDREAGPIQQAPAALDLGSALQ